MAEPLSRDPFIIIDEGEKAARFNSQIGLSIDLNPVEALTALGLDAPSDPRYTESLGLELRAAERRFCRGTHGVGVFSGNSGQETQFWDYMLRKFAAGIDLNNTGTLASLSVPQAFDPKILMPGEFEQGAHDMAAAGFAFRTGASDLAKAIESVVGQTRIDSSEPMTFIVTMPEIPDHVIPLMQFDASLLFDNKSATELNTQASHEQRDYFDSDTEAGSTHVRNLRRRLKAFLDETISQEVPEQIPDKLRTIGQQTSPFLAQGLEYLYYKRLLSFIDAGSGYRIVPENVRIGLVTDKTVFDAMLAGGLNDPYSTIGLGLGVEAALGCYATIPRSFEQHGDVLDKKINTLRNGVWQQDPVTPTMTAALLFADAELPRLPSEDLRDS